MMEKTGSSLRPARNLRIAPELAEVQALMPIDSGDYENLKKDIRKNGIRDALKIYVKDNNYYVVGGFNRLKIALELEIKDPLPIDIYEGKPAEFKELAIIDNLNRRHLTMNQKRKIAEELIKTDPGKSALQIAKQTGLTDKTAGKLKKELQRRSEIPNVETVTDSKGRVQPATKPKPTLSVSAVLAADPPAAAPKSTQARKDFYMYFHALLTTSEAGTISTVMVDLLERVKAERPKEAKKIFKTLSETINDLL